MSTHRHRPAQMGRLIRATLFAAQGLVAVACESASPPPLLTMTITQFDTVVTESGGRVGYVTGMAVDSIGRVWMSDALNHRILVLDDAGNEVLEIGREGAGPGEFLRPDAIAISDSRAIVLDHGNRRLQYFDLDGSFQELHAWDSPLLLPTSMTTSGELAIPALGREGYLLEVIDRPGTSRKQIGEARGPMPSSISLQRIREQVQEGVVPAEFRNNVTPFLGEDSRVWLVVQAEGRVEHYDDLGTLVWTYDLPSEEVAAAMETFRAGIMARLILPVTVQSGVLVGDHLWLMLDRADGVGGIIVMLHAATGREVGPAELELDARIGSFAVNPATGRLVMFLREEGSVVAANVPTAVF